MDVIINNNKEKKIYPYKALRQIFKYYNFIYTVRALYRNKKVSLEPAKYLNNYIISKTLVKPFRESYFDSSFMSSYL